MTSRQLRCEAAIDPIAASSGTVWPRDTVYPIAEDHHISGERSVSMTRFTRCPKTSSNRAIRSPTAGYNIALCTHCREDPIMFSSDTNNFEVPASLIFASCSDTRPQALFTEAGFGAARYFGKIPENRPLRTWRGPQTLTPKAFIGPVLACR